MLDKKLLALDRNIDAYLDLDTTITGLSEGTIRIMCGSPDKNSSFPETPFLKYSLLEQPTGDIATIYVTIQKPEVIDTHINDLAKIKDQNLTELKEWIALNEVPLLEYWAINIQILSNWLNDEFCKRRLQKIKKPIDRTFRDACIVMLKELKPDDIVRRTMSGDITAKEMAEGMAKGDWEAEDFMSFLFRFSLKTLVRHADGFRKKDTINE